MHTWSSAGCKDVHPRRKHVYTFSGVAPGVHPCTCTCAEYPPLAGQICRLAEFARVFRDFASAGDAASLPPLKFLHDDL